jgi:hypothetical protein
MAKIMSKFNIKCISICISIVLNLVTTSILKVHRVT